MDFKIPQEYSVHAPVERGLLSIIPVLSLLLNRSSGTPLLQNNNFLHCNDHMFVVSLGKMLLAIATSHFLAVSFRQKKPDSYLL